MSKESDFQRKLIEELEQRFPGCIVVKNDPTYIQGIPDLTMLYKDTWVSFECKRSEKELKKPRPNQGYWINYMKDKMGGLSFFIYPEIKEAVLDEVQQALRIRGYSCVL